MALGLMVSCCVHPRQHLKRGVGAGAGGQGKALEAARAELVQSQGQRAQESHEWEQRVREQAGALRDLEHRLHVQRDDGVVRMQELERSVRLLSTKSDAHKALATATSEVTALRTAQERLKNDVAYFRQRAEAAEQENKASMERVVALQCKLNAAQYAPSSCPQLVTTMSEQIEAQEVEVERLEGMLRVAKQQHDQQAAEAELMRARHDEQLTAAQLLADTHQRRVLQLQGELQAVEDAARKSSEADADGQELVRRSLVSLLPSAPLDVLCQYLSHARSLTPSCLALRF